MQFAVELAKEVTKHVSIHGFKLVADLGFGRLVQRWRRRKVEQRFGVELRAWSAYLAEMRSCLAAGQAAPAPPPRVLFVDGQDVLRFASDLDDDSRAGLILAQFCIGEMSQLAGAAASAESLARVERLWGYFERVSGLLG